MFVKWNRLLIPSLKPRPIQLRNKMLSSTILEGLLDHSSMNLSQIKKIYSSFEEYQVHLCLFNDSNTSLARAFSSIGTQTVFIRHLFLKNHAKESLIILLLAFSIYQDLIRKI